MDDEHAIAVLEVLGGMGLGDEQCWRRRRAVLGSSDGEQCWRAVLGDEKMLGG